MGLNHDELTFFQDFNCVCVWGGGGGGDDGVDRISQQCNSPQVDALEFLFHMIPRTAKFPVLTVIVSPQIIRNDFQSEFHHQTIISLFYFCSFVGKHMYVGPTWASLSKLILLWEYYSVALTEK